MVRDHEHDTDGIALDERVSSLLSAAAAPSEPGPLPGEGAALAAFRAAQPQPRRSPHRSVLVAARSGMAAAMAGLLLTGGVAAATAGVLPGLAQDTVDGVLVDLGLSPADADAGREHATGTDDSEQAEPSVPTTGDAVDGEDTAAEGATSEPDAADAADADAADADDTAGAHGKEVSRTARETEATGAAKGAEIAGLASRGRSRAGEDRPQDRPDAAHTARTRPSGAAAAARLRAERSAAARAPGTPRRPAGAGRP